MIGSHSTTIDGQFYWVLFMQPHAVWDSFIHFLAVWMTGNVAVFTAAMIDVTYDRAKLPYSKRRRPFEPFKDLGLADGMIMILIIMLLAAPLVAYFSTVGLIRAARKGVFFNFKVSRAK